MACGGRKGAPADDGGGPANPPGGPAPAGPITVTGSERIGWDQQISAGSIQDHQFMAFVDGRRTSLPDIQCAAAPGPSGYLCSAQLPYMTDGRHTIRLAASRRRDAEEPVSDRSGELVVIKRSSGTAAADARVAESEPDVPRGAAADAAFAVEIVATNLAPVSDLAVLPDGRLVIAERSGFVRILSNRGSGMGGITALDGVSQTGGGLMAIAAHPAFSRNHLLYLLYATDTSRGVYRLARGREVAGRLGEFAALGDLAPAERDGSGALRFGADGKLYVALSSLSAAADPEASYRGKVLRLEDDGRTPDDSAGGSPVFSSGYARVFGVAPAPMTGAWFATEVAEGGRIRLLRRNTPGAASPEPRSLIELGAAVRPGGLLVYSGRAVPSWRGNLLVALLDGQGIMRVPLSGEATKPTLLPHLAAFGRIRSLVEDGDGSIYFGTANRELAAVDGSSDDDRVVRVSPRVPGA